MGSQRSLPIREHIKVLLTLTTIMVDAHHYQARVGVIGVEPTTSDLANRRSVGAWNREEPYPQSAELHAHSHIPLISNILHRC